MAVTVESQVYEQGGRQTKCSLKPRTCHQAMSAVTAGYFSKGRRGMSCQVQLTAQSVQRQRFKGPRVAQWASAALPLQQTLLPLLSLPMPFSSTESPKQM